MKETDKLIEKFRLGTLDHKDLKRIQVLRLEDKGFDEKWSMEEDLSQVIRHEGHRVLKSKMAAWEEETNKRPGFIRLFDRQPIVSMAASILVLVVLGLGIYSISGRFNPTRYYQTNFEPFPNTVVPLERSESTNASLPAKAFYAYESKQYEQATKYFRSMDQTGSCDYCAFYLAQSLMALGETSEAQDLLQEVINKNKNFKAESLWYSALAYLKEGKLDRSKQRLEEIKKNKGFKSDEAAKLLKKL